MPSRRALLQTALSTSAALALSACTRQEPCTPSTPASGLDSDDLRLLASARDPLPIVQREPAKLTVLRRLARPLTARDQAHLAVLEQRMRRSLIAAEGVGLAAPQVGLGVRAVLVMLGARSKQPRTQLFLNPRIVERSDDVVPGYEGCLSVPDVCGLVRRNRRIVVVHGIDDARLSRTEAEGFDARIFQHELDHLDGVLYIDRVEGGLQPKERLKELRDELRKTHPELASYSPEQDAVLL